MALMQLVELMRQQVIKQHEEENKLDKDNLKVKKYDECRGSKKKDK